MTALTSTAMWSIPRVGAPVASERWIVAPVTTTSDNDAKPLTRLWRIDPATGATRPLTRKTDSATRPVFSPSGERLAFLRQIDGKAQVHVIGVDGGEATAVTAMSNGVIGSIWAPDGRTLYVVSNVEPDQAGGHEGVHTSDHALYRYWDRWLTDDAYPHIFSVDSTSGESLDLTPSAHRWMRWENTGDPIADMAISPDGQTLVYCADASPAPHREIRIAAFVIDLASGAETQLLPDFNGHVSRPRFSAGGQLLVGLQTTPDYYADQVQLAYVDVASGERHMLALDDWDRSPSMWEWEGDRLLLVAEDRARTRLYEWRGDDARPVALTDGGAVSGFDALGRDVIVTHSSLLVPPEIHRVGSSGLEPLSTFTSKAMGPLDMPAVEEIEVMASNDEPVQAFLVADSGERLPLVHMIHGGPHGLFGDQWHWRWNAAVLASAGYLVALVNFAGSTSFGDGYAQSIHGEWGKRPALDIEAVTDHLVGTQRVDPERMAITGGSYGGYLVSWLSTQTDRYKCAIAHAAVTNLPAMYASDITMGLSRAYGSEAFEDLDAVQTWSPMAHASSAQTPTLVIHGDRDFRVPVTQGLEYYGMLQAKGVEARIVHFADEGHWILDRQHSLLWYREVLDWLARFLQ